MLMVKPPCGWVYTLVQLQTYPQEAFLASRGKRKVLYINYLHSACRRLRPKCLVCRGPLTLDEGWHVHHLLWRSHGGTELIANLVLLHPNSHRQVHSEGLVVEKFASREGRS
jgi:RNA-directed DNA polymerase